MVADEAYVSAEQPAAKANPWLSLPHGDARGPKRFEATAPQGTQAAHRESSRQACPSLIRVAVTQSRSGEPPTQPGSTANQSTRPTFGKEYRVRRRAEFLKIQRRGRKRHSENFVVLSIGQTRPQSSRFGFSVSRRVGNAVVRNLLKRRLREFCRLYRHELPSGRDFVVIAKPGAAKLTYAEVVQELRVPLSS